jgi:hypothetical protein
MPFKYTTKKGDTLNKIANQFGFRNYKDAGIRSVASGNFDQIGIGEQIVLENYDPNRVQTSPTATPPVISSKDNAQAFADNKNKLETILAGQRPDATTGEPTPEPTPTPTPTPEGGTGAPTNEQIINDPLYTKSRADDRAKIAQATVNNQQEVDDYTASIGTRLQDVDAVTRSAIERITLTANKRIKEQERINTINTDRVRAYGVGGSGIYKPIQFSDAITERERKGAEEVQELERLRDSAIAEAENAGRLGKSNLLAEKLEGLNDIEDRLRTKLSAIDKESDEQYNLLVKLRKEKEAERLKKVEEVTNRLKAFISLNKDEYENMTPEQIEEKVAEVMRVSNLSYSEAYNAIMDGIQVDLKDVKTQAEIEKIKAQTATEAERAKTERSKQAKNYRTDDKKDEDFTNTQKQKLEQAGLGDAERQQKLDFFYDEFYNEADYVQSAEVGSIVVIEGKRYKKTADNDFELIE